MQPWAPGTLEFHSISPSVFSETQAILSFFNNSPHPNIEGYPSPSQRELCRQDVELLYKFNSRTISTLCKPELIPHYREVYAKLIPFVC